MYVSLCVSVIICVFIAGAPLESNVILSNSVPMYVCLSLKSSISPGSETANFDEIWHAGSS